MKARDIMTQNPRVVTPETSVQEAARLMKTEDTGVLPVVDSEGSRRLVGVITDRDIAIRVVGDGMSSAQVRDAMSANPKTCRPDDNVKDVLQAMSDSQVRRIPIVDDGGSVVGIVSQADVVLETDGRKVEKTIEKISQPGANN
ncbi:CBS domain containing protein [Gemmatirosa kalamazoonensis]|uniref:CBS domain containing protein n=1 Tax=Gemmatirosa kalamazoonensis TaxID=861299 RepID=W0RC05_9BACT|nr:CBS domain-containing protein [Gemmatirosa kalamazoonensis]AHG87982.1 CBS domain containing protein [Gemmatirosa kalamazoonensis]